MRTLTASPLPVAGGKLHSVKNIDFGVRVKSGKFLNLAFDRFTKKLRKKIQVPGT
jgi:hypothetical protein